MSALELISTLPAEVWGGLTSSAGVILALACASIHLRRVTRGR